LISLDLRWFTIAGLTFGHYDQLMIRIRFPDSASERRALGYLTGRFSYRSWANGETLVPEAALAAMAVEGIPFVVEGPAT
jgi:hypothetical protein